jgi:hypothetical protein
MLALSVRQPWASLIASGRKSIEVRTWGTRHRGPLVICASRSRARGGQVPDGDGPRGCTVVLVDLVDVRPWGLEDLGAAMYQPERPALAWVLSNPRPLIETPVCGRLSLWAIDQRMVRVARASARID